MTTLKHKSLLTKMYQIHKNIETLLFGNDEINIRKHSMIFNNVREYIRQTKRF